MKYKYFACEYTRFSMKSIIHPTDKKWFNCEKMSLCWPEPISTMKHDWILWCTKKNIIASSQAPDASSATVERRTMSLREIFQNHISAAYDSIQQKQKHVP